MLEEVGEVDLVGILVLEAQEVGRMVLQMLKHPMRQQIVGQEEVVALEVAAMLDKVEVV